MTTSGLPLHLPEQEGECWEWDVDGFDLCERDLQNKEEMQEPSTVYAVQRRLKRTEAVPM